MPKSRRRRCTRLGTSTYVKLHDLLSQIIDFGGTDVEKHAIFFRPRAPHLKGTQISDAIDLSEVRLVGITHKKKGTGAVDLVGADPTALKPTTAAGSRARHDPNLVLFDELIAKLNELFAGEQFEDHQVRSWVHGLLEGMKADPQPRDQATANSREQFFASHALRDKLLIAVAMNGAAQRRMAELIHEKASIEDAVLRSLGELLYAELHEPSTMRVDVHSPRDVDIEVGMDHRPPARSGHALEAAHRDRSQPGPVHR